MGGGSTEQTPVSRQEAALGPQATSLLQQFAANPQAILSQFQQALPGQSALNQQVGQTFQQLIQRPTAQQQTFQQVMPQLQGLVGAASPDQTIAAAQTLQQQNLDLLRQQTQQAGNPFRSGNQQIVADAAVRSANEFNLFANQARQQSLQQQAQFLGAMLPFAQGADVSQQQLLGQAGQFGLGQQGLAQQGALGQNQINAQLASQFLGPLFFGGGITQDPAFIHKGGFFSDLIGGIGAVGSLVPGVGDLLNIGASAVGAGGKK